jgi:chemotaxis protein methyltransferase CheR
MIYFTGPLQERVLSLLHGSLVPFGLLGLGAGESLRLTAFDGMYEPIAGGQRLYKRRG